MKLTAKQQRFCDEYLVDLNATQAAVRAGYSKKTASVIGAENLAKPNIKEYLSSCMKERSEQTKIDAEYVLNRLAAIDRMDVLDILNDNGSLKAIKDWPKVWRQYLSGMDLSEIWDGTGDEKQAIGMLKKIKWPDKLKNLELLGKHVNVGAFSDKVDHQHAFVDSNGEPLSFNINTIYVSPEKKK